MTVRNIAGIDWQANQPIVVSSVSQLKKILQDFSEHPPGIIELSSARGERLQLGLGGGFGFAEFLKADNMPPYLCATPRKLHTMQDTKFLCGGTPTEIGPLNCLSVEEAMEVAEYFFENAQPSPNFKWEEV